jgi:hypothetical protein
MRRHCTGCCFAKHKILIAKGLGPEAPTCVHFTLHGVRISPLGGRMGLDNMKEGKRKRGEQIYDAVWRIMSEKAWVRTWSPLPEQIRCGHCATFKNENDQTSLKPYRNFFDLRSLKSWVLQGSTARNHQFDDE